MVDINILVSSRNGWYKQFS